MSKHALPYLGCSPWMDNNYTCFGAFIMFIKVKIDDLLGRNQNVHTSASSKMNKKQQNTFKNLNLTHLLLMGL